MPRKRCSIAFVSRDGDSGDTPGIGRCTGAAQRHDRVPGSRVQPVPRRPQCGVITSRNNHENKLDLYLPANPSGPTPVLMMIHGGGWVQGTKEAQVLRLLPYLEMGWAVANVTYRLVQVSKAPAAVEDCLCALQWIARNAERYNFDTSRIVTSGNSAGGHLALTSGMVPPSTGLGRECVSGSFTERRRSRRWRLPRSSTGTASPTWPIWSKDRTRKATPSSGLAASRTGRR